MGLRSSSTGYLISVEIDCQTVRWHTAVASVRSGKSAGKLYGSGKEGTCRQQRERFDFVFQNAVPKYQIARRMHSLEANNKDTVPEDATKTKHTSIQ